MSIINGACTQTTMFLSFWITLPKPYINCALLHTIYINYKYMYLLRTWTSSSLRIGIVRTLYFCLNSLERGDDINLRLMCEGAVKCLFLFLRLDDVTNLFSFISRTAIYNPETPQSQMKHSTHLKIINTLRVKRNKSAKHHSLCLTWW